MQNKSVKEICTNDLLHLKNHGMDISFGMGGNLAWAENECINIATEKKSMRDILYMICGQLTPKPFIWILFTRKNPSTLWDGTCREIFKEIHFVKIESKITAKRK